MVRVGRGSSGTLLSHLFYICARRLGRSGPTTITWKGAKTYGGYRDFVMAESPCSIEDIVAALECVRTHHELKIIAREVGRRATRLTAEHAATFEPKTKVYYRSGGRIMPGVVQQPDGSHVIVKLAHGFVARIPPDKLRK